MKLVSLIVPCFNEEESISEFKKELDQELYKLDYDFEIIFINDGSNDTTLKHLKSFLDSDIKTRIINFSRNFGKEAAVLAGLDYCLGDCAIIIDADLQMPVTRIKDLIAAWEGGYHLVLTCREKRQSGLRDLVSEKYYDVHNYLSDDKILKNALDFQLMDREIIKVMCSMREHSRFLKGLTGFIGFKYKIIPIEIKERFAGKSKFAGTRKLLRYAFKSLATHSDAPLKIAIKIGTIVSVFAFIYMIYIFLKTIIYGIDVSGYASIITIMLFMFGIVLLILGIMGYYIGLIYNEVKQRPNYIVEEYLSNNEGDK